MQRNESSLTFMLAGNGFRNGGSYPNVTYTVEVRSLDAATGEPLDPPLGTLTFTGAPSTQSLPYTHFSGSTQVRTLHLRITSSHAGPFGFEIDALAVGSAAP